MTNPSSSENGNTKWKERDIDDIALQHFIRRMYKMFTLFNGTFQDIHASEGEDKFKSALNYFFSKYIEATKLDQLDVFSTLEGIYAYPSLILQVYTFFQWIRMFTCKCSHSLTPWKTQLKKFRLQYFYMKSSYCGAV